MSQAQLTVSFTPAQILALPAFVDLVTTGRALGKGRSTTFAEVSRDAFPVAVLRNGNERGCTLAAICEYLQIPFYPQAEKEGRSTMKQEFKMVESRSPEGLEEGVNELLDQGWRLHGVTMMAGSGVGDGSTINRFVQALVREEG